MKNKHYIDMLLSVAFSFLIGAIIIAFMGYSPLEVYAELFKGAFQGKFNFGGTLERFVPLLLTGLAFAVSSEVAVFNVGVEGELYLGAIFAAWAGFAIKGLPAFIHIPLCIIVGMVIGALWAAIPAILRAYYKVNEVCSTILLNYVAMFIASYLVSYPLSAKTGVAQTPAIQDSAKLAHILKPSRANIGIFIAIAAILIVYWILYRTSAGYKLRSVGLNPFFSDYIGIDAKKIMVRGMMLSGAIGGLAGAIEVMGIYGRYLDNFSQGIAFDGMLACLIARNDIKMLPIVSLFLAVLKTGALGMERFTGVPQSLIDAIISMFILFAAMEGLFTFKKKKASKIAAQKVQA